MKIRILIWLFFTGCLISCQQRRHSADISFYYWKTVLDLKPSELAVLKANQVKKLYVRYFDVALGQDEQPHPVGQIELRSLPDSLEIIPVVYIKNEVMLSPKVEVGALAKRISDYIQVMNEAHQVNYKEIQIDCDWSLKSRDNFMAFIDSLGNTSDKQLSATIRLHQIKYAQKTKVPKVDYGVLMYYNMGEINAGDHRSIYDKTIADLYTATLEDYPLPLQVALPVFAWGIHLRNGHVLGLKNKLTGNSLLEDGNFHQLKPNFFEAKIDTFRNGTYYRKGDLVKIESISKSDLIEMADDLRKLRHFDTILFYDLDSLNIMNYEKDIFGQVRAAF